MPKELQPIADLDEATRRFVRYLARGREAALAGKDCGFTESQHNNLLRQSQVVWAIRVERQRLLTTEGASLGYAVLVELAGDESVNPAVRRAAAKDLLTLGGHVAPKAENDKKDVNDKPLAEMSSDELRALVDRLDSELANRAKPVSDSPGNA